MGQEPTITLSIKESGERLNTTYLFHILLDGKALTSNQSLSLPDSQAVREISRCFGALFEQGCRPEKDADAQRALGKQLFDLWLATSWEKIMAAVPVGSLRFLVIASDIPEILNLPWELLLPPDSDFLGINPLFRIRRFPSSAKQMAPFTGELRARPLRLLFMACAPTDQPTLDYEKEEEALFRAIYGQDVAFDSCDLGTFEELKEKVSEFQPHIVHLTGHGAVLDGQGRFAFECEDGTADLVPAEDLRRFLVGSGVQCVFVSGCQSGKAPREALSGICQSLVGAEVPLAVGWAASIADDLATNFARTFYRTLKDGQPVDRALLLARQEAWKACQKRGDPSWTLPVIYAATNQIHIFDPDPQRPLEALTRQNMVLDALPGMKEGHAEHFVGRRREQQRLLPALRSGDLQVVIITGLGGSGKSTLATRLARKLETYRYIPIPVSSSKTNPLNSARLLQAFGDAFRKTARRARTVNAPKADELTALAEDLNNPKLSVDSRLHDAVAALNEGRFLLLLDNFESNLDEADLHILDAEVAGFYIYLLESLSGGSRAIITTRYPPSNVSKLPPKVHREELGDFSESSFLKILQRDPEVERRIRFGELPLSLLKKLHQTFGGTPCFLLQIREVIKRMDAEMLKKELAKVELPSATKPGELQKIRLKYFDDIFTENLYGYLCQESQIALSRSAVYGVPVTLVGLAAAAVESQDCIEAFAHEWKDRAFAYQETGKALWSIYGLLRGWLLTKLTQEELMDANMAAGNFLIMDQQNRGDEVGLSLVDCLMEARSRYLDALEIYLRLGIYPFLGLELARRSTDLLSGFLTRSGNYESVRQLNSELLIFEEHPSPMSWIGRTHSLQGDYDSARYWYKRALSASSGRNLAEEGSALHGLATIDMKQGQYDSAETKFEKVLEIMKQTGDLDNEAGTWQCLASISLEKGQFDSAKEKYEKAMKIIRHQNGSKDILAESAILFGLATMDIRQSQFDSAKKKFKKSLRLIRKIGDRFAEAQAWHSLASIDQELGRYNSAKDMFEKSMKIKQQIGDRPGEAQTWGALASICLNIGDYKTARENFWKAIKIMQQIGDRAGEASTWHLLASIDLENGDYQAGRENSEKAIKIWQQIGERIGEAATFGQLGVIAWQQGKIHQAMKFIAIRYLIHADIGDPGTRIAYENLCTIASQLSFSQEQLDALQEEVAEAYKKDHGQGLIDAAFPKA